MEVLIIKEVVIIFGLSIAVLLFCHRLGLPTIVGFLVTGVLSGPHGLGLIQGVEAVQTLAAIGIVLLLFTVGMEFSIQKMIKHKYYFLWGGFLQVFTTLLICFLVSRFLYEDSWGGALFFGFLISLSSTAIVLRALDDKGDSDTPHGKFIISILIFQDIVAVPMMLSIPVLSGADESFNLSQVYMFFIGIVVLAAMAIAAFKMVPKLLYYVARTRNRELFLLTVLAIGFGVAWITSSVGLSLSLGAFLAGLIISESEYSEEAIGHVLPFQEIFTSFFFVSMGMLLDISFVINQPFYILSITVLVILLKSVVGASSALALGMPLRSSILSGISLGQVGEFSFVLALSGMQYGLTSDYYYQLFLAVSLLTMTLTPFLIAGSPYIAQYAEALPLPLKLKTGYNWSARESNKEVKQNHIIIVGFGIRGRHLARAAKEAGIPYEILEMNADTVNYEMKRGEPIHYGDATHKSVLNHSGIKQARILAIVINDHAASYRIVKLAKELNPDVYVVARTRYFSEVPSMLQVGANDVIPDEFGSSIEIFTRVLEKCEHPQELIFKHVSELRVEGYETLHWHSSELPFSPETQLDLNKAHIQTFNVSEKSPLVGQTIIDSGLRKNHGITILQIKRLGVALPMVEPDTQIELGDVLIVVGTPDHLKIGKSLFTG